MRESKFDKMCGLRQTAVSGAIRWSQIKYEPLMTGYRAQTAIIKFFYKGLSNFEAISTNFRYRWQSKYFVVVGNFVPSQLSPVHILTLSFSKIRQLFPHSSPSTLQIIQASIMPLNVTCLAVFLLTFNNNKNQTQRCPITRLLQLSTTTCLQLTPLRINSRHK
jgi:hypothetical protein